MANFAVQLNDKFLGLVDRAGANYAEPLRSRTQHDELGEEGVFEISPRRPIDHS